MMRYCILDNRGVQGVELPCHGNFETLTFSFFFFLQMELTAECVEFLCKGSFLQSFQMNKHISF